ncbi:MAG: hypothetical protein WEC12_06790 [Balneolaceae bacterium]
MNRKTVKRIFIFFLFFLPLQYGLIGVVSLYHSEPWPAFIFPGFKNVYVFEADTYAIVDLEFQAWCEETEETVVMDPLSLFNDIPRSQSQGFLRMNFRDRDKAGGFNEQAVNWLKKVAENRHPGHRFTRLDAVWTENYYTGPSRTAGADSTHEINRITIPL